jgi:hypothetical protein
VNSSLGRVEVKELCERRKFARKCGCVSRFTQQEDRASHAFQPSNKQSPDGHYHRCDLRSTINTALGSVSTSFYSLYSMATSREISGEISELIQRDTTNISHRANRVAAHELSRFSPEDVALILAQLHPEIERLGNNDPCGPAFNQYTNFPLWMHAVIGSLLATGTLMLVPLQLGAAVGLLFKRRFKALWREIPTPTIMLLSWGMGMTAYAKPAPRLVEQSIQPGVALCVNRNGSFKLLKRGYSVVSHVWGETMGWQTPTSWGPVELPLRKKGLYLGHLQKFFDRCDAEWLWLNVLAMPEVYEDMPDGEKERTEQLRVQITNRLRGVYERADRVVVLDTLLLRLHTGSMIDVAVILALSRWMTRLWCFTESRLAKSVVLKTADAAFDLDELLDFLYQTINNEDHRYFPLVLRLASLRPVSEENVGFLRSALHDTAGDPPHLVKIYHGCENRYTDVEVDQARALYPFLDLQWTSGWSLKDGLRHVQESFPEQRDMLERYCRYRNLESLLPL